MRLFFFPYSVFILGLFPFSLPFCPVRSRLHHSCRYCLIEEFRSYRQFSPPFREAILSFPSYLLLFLYLRTIPFPEALRTPPSPSISVLRGFSLLIGSSACYRQVLLLLLRLNFFISYGPAATPCGSFFVQFPPLHRKSCPPGEKQTLSSLRIVPVLRLQPFPRFQFLRFSLPSLFPRRTFFTFCVFHYEMMERFRYQDEPFSVSSGQIGKILFWLFFLSPSSHRPPPFLSNISCLLLVPRFLIWRISWH